MLNDNEIEPNAFKVYVISRNKRSIVNIRLVGVFESSDYAFNYCNYYLFDNEFYIVDPKGNVIYY